MCRWTQASWVGGHVMSSHSLARRTMQRGSRPDRLDLATVQSHAVRHRDGWGRCGSDVATVRRHGRPMIDALLERHPRNIVRLILPRLVCDPVTGANPYHRSAQRLRRWRDDGVLRTDPEPPVRLRVRRRSTQGAWPRRRGRSPQTGGAGCPAARGRDRGDRGGSSRP